LLIHRPMAVVWGGTISKPVGAEPSPAGGYAAVQALLVAVAALICAALLAVGALR